MFLVDKNWRHGAKSFLFVILFLRNFVNLMMLVYHPAQM